MTATTQVSAAARALDLVKIFGQGDAAVEALDHVTVAFPTQRFSAIMGPSGSGKSTLMHRIAGLDNVTSGKVFIGCTAVTALNDEAHHRPAARPFWRRRSKSRRPRCSTGRCSPTSR